MKTYLIEYKATMPSGMIRSGLHTQYATDESQAEKKADTYLRMSFEKAEIVISETVEV